MFHLMKIESTSFGPGEVAGFLDELIDRDRLALVERLRRASHRLGDLGNQVPEGGAERVAGDAAQWSAQDVLAHIAVLSKFYGVVAYQIGCGRLTEIDLLRQIVLRDVVGDRFARQPPAQLVALAQEDHRRTMQWLQSAAPADLRRRCDTGGGGSMTAEEVARLALCTHLEQHVDQLEAALG
jgi:DinB family protein